MNAGLLTEPQASVHILEAAFHSFNELGYADVRMDDLARTLRISKKTIYKHYPSKEALLEATLAARMEQVTRTLKTLQGKPVADYLKAFFAVYHDWRRSLQPVLQQSLQTHAPHLADRLHVFETQVIRKELGANLKLMRGARQIQYPSPTREFADTLLAFSAAYVHAPESQKNFLLELLLKGIVVRKKKK